MTAVAAAPRTEDHHSFSGSRAVVTAAGLGLGAAATGVVIAVSSASASTDPWSTETPWPLIQGVSFGVVATVLGAFLIVRGAPRPVGGILLVAGLARNLEILLFSAGTALLADHADHAELAVIVLLGGQALWPLFVVLPMAALPLTFPGGRLPGRTWRALSVLTAVAVAGLSVASLTAPVVGSDRGGRGIENPLSWSVQPLLVSVFNGAALVSAIGGLAALGIRTVRGSPLVRRQITLLLVALAATVAAILIEPVLPDAVFQVLMTVCPVLILLAIATAVLAFDLYGIALVISRAAVYLGLTVVMGAVFLAAYVTVVAAAAGLSPSFDRWVAVGISAVVVVVCFEPLRRRLRDGVERRLLGERSRPLAALQTLRRSVLDSDPAVVPEIEVARVVARAVRSPQVEVVLYGAGVAADGPTTFPVDVTAPLLHRHERIGEFRIAPRSPGERFDRRDRELITHLADEAAALLYGVRREAELAAARTEAITSAAQERARIGRDLHDGLGPLLAGAGLAAEALRRSLRPGSADERDAARLAERLRRAAGEVRHLAHDLQPVAISESGLAAALAGHLDSLRGDRLPTIELTVEAPELPAAVSQVAYLVVLEAVANVVRHAQAGVAEVTVLANTEEVVVTVADDGVGLGASFRSGLGVTSMRRRVEALGGAFSLTDRDRGGTALQARIPRGR